MPMTDFHEICTFLLNNTPPVQPPAWLEGIKPDPSARSGDQNASLKGKLVEKFDTADLLAAGVLERVSKGRNKTQLAKILAGDWIALRDPSGKFFDILGQDACLRDAGPAL